MQQIERLFGFGIRLDESLDPYRIDVLKGRAARLMAREDFDPDLYHLYFHQLTITLRKSHFAGTLTIGERLEELRLTFARNPKQDRNRAIRFYNHLIDDPEPVAVQSSAGESEVTYYLKGSYLASKLQFRNELMTFIRKDLRPDHRKIKISVQAFPTTNFQLRLRKKRKSYVTKLDLVYERYTPVNIPNPQPPAPAPGKKDIPEGQIQMNFDDKKRLVNTLTVLADYSDDSERWFKQLINDSNLPFPFKSQIKPLLKGDAEGAASRLIDFAYSRGTQEENHELTYLGAILEKLLESNIGLEKSQLLTALILIYRLYRSPIALERLHQRYGAPGLLRTESIPKDFGTWLGPEPAEDIELHGFLQRNDGIIDVGFLERAMSRAGAVCRVDTATGAPLGTGFLVDQDKVLTNYHVVQPVGSNDLDASAILLRFRNVTAANGKEAEGLVFRTTGRESILAKSGINDLDFVLLQVEERIKTSPGVGVAPLDISVPSPKTPLNILQHAGGRPLGLAFSNDGIRGVYPDRGLVQYVTQAVGGSSGSPCFNDVWKVVALHHAERSRSFGSIREGILMSKIFPLIKGFLSVVP
jgi:Trypsin-like peptidase domain